MKTIVILLAGALIAACSDEPDCVTDAQFSAKVRAGETRYSELSKHMTCYDKNGNRY